MSLAMIACYLTSFENRHFREVSFYEAFIWFSPFFNGIWHDPGAHFPKEFSMGQHRHFSDDCRVQYVLPMRFYAFSSGRITVKQLPSSTWLDTSMVPCIRSMIRFVMESPSQALRPLSGWNARNPGGKIFQRSVSSWRHPCQRRYRGWRHAPYLL